METVERREETVRFDDPAVLADLFGSQDDHLRIVEKSLGVTILPKGNALNVIGDPLQVEVSVKVLTGLYHVLRKGIPITSNAVVAAVKIVRSDRNAEVASVFQDVVFKSSRNKIITPKSVAQKKYLDAMRDFDIVFARPAVEAGEKLGFLPGDMAEKVNPYLRPLHDALYTMLEYEQAGRMMERGGIGAAPLAFMRGRTLNDSFVILDEAQNTTTEQMKMFLTRIGFGSKAVITGDITQTDLPTGRISGLNEALSILKDVEGIRFCWFTEIDG